MSASSAPTATPLVLRVLDGAGLHLAQLDSSEVVDLNLWNDPVTLTRTVEPRRKFSRPGDDVTKWRLADANDHAFAGATEVQPASLYRTFIVGRRNDHFELTPVSHFVRMRRVSTMPAMSYEDAEKLQSDRRARSDRWIRLRFPTEAASLKETVDDEDDDVFGTGLGTRRAAKSSGKGSSKREDESDEFDDVVENFGHHSDSGDDEPAKLQDGEVDKVEAVDLREDEGDERSDDERSEASGTQKSDSDDEEGSDVLDNDDTSSESSSGSSSDDDMPTIGGPGRGAAAAASSAAGTSSGAQSAKRGRSPVRASAPKKVNVGAAAPSKPRELNADELVGFMRASGGTVKWPELRDAFAAFTKDAAGKEKFRVLLKQHTIKRGEGKDVALSLKV